jgi:hypothetical protein
MVTPQTELYVVLQHYKGQQPAQELRQMKSVAQRKTEKCDERKGPNALLHNKISFFKI